MKTFKIPISWSVCSYVEEEADSVEEALEKAIKFEKEHGYDLPTDPDYIDGSFEINEDIGFMKIINS